MQVSRWYSLPEEYKLKAFYTMRKLMFSAFLFKTSYLPPKWLKWAREKDMIGAYSSDESDLPSKKLLWKHYLGLRMMDVSFDFMQQLATSDVSAAKNIVKMICYYNDYPSEALRTAINAINDIRTQDENFRRMMNNIIIKMSHLICDERYPESRESEDYIAAADRRTLVSMLVCRQFAECICIITCECRDIVKEVENFDSIKNDGYKQHIEELREEGKNHFLKGRYQKAYEVYTNAIDKTKFEAVFYSNRCNASIKLGDYEAAFYDAYRAAVLSPNWAKAYYNMMKCLNQMNLKREALYWGGVGTEKCKKDPGFGEFDTLYRTIKNLKGDEQTNQEVEQEDETDDITGAQSSKSAKRRNRKKKRHKKSSIEEDFDEMKINQKVPSLVSDDEEWDKPESKLSKIGISRFMSQKDDSPVEDTATSEENMKELEKTIAEENKRLAEKEKRRQEAAKRKIEKEERRVKREEDRKESEAKRIKMLKEKREREEKEKQERVKKEQEEKVERQRLENIRLVKEQEEKERKLQGKKEMRFQIHVEEKAKEGTMCLLQETYVNAVKYYTSAIEFLEAEENLDMREAHTNEFVILLYARGTASLNQMIPTEIDISAKYFTRILEDYKKFGHLSMIYYGLGKANYNLNNFKEAEENISKGFTLISKSPPHGLLTWPGSKNEIPESKPKDLRQLLHNMLQECRVPPRPLATCRYDSCLKDYSRKEIYLTDVDFEGYFIISCEWQCSLCFHLKCWSKYKHDYLTIPGDKDVLGTPCFTPDCGGRIIIIEMIDERGISKNPKKLPVEKKKNKNTEDNDESPEVDKYSHRTSKSQINLANRMRAIAENKRKKMQYRRPDDSANKFPLHDNQKNKDEYVPIDQDLTTATIYLKPEDSITTGNTQKTKSKTRSNRRAGPVSLQYFCSTLPGYRRDMSMQEIADAIESANESGNPFFLPDELREEIEEFELTLSGEHVTVFTDDERTKVPFLFEYFQDFFTQNGPLKIGDDLFNSQLLLLPPNMQEIVSKGGGLRTFLNSSQLFIQIPPYIGIYSQQDKMAQLVGGQCAEIVTNLNSCSSSSVDLTSPLHELNLEMNEQAMSQFAKDFYQVGAPVEDIDIPGLTGGPDSAHSSQGAMYRLDEFIETNKITINNSETSSQFSLDDELKSEGGSLASFESERISLKNQQRKRNVPNDPPRTPTLNTSAIKPRKPGKKKANRPVLAEASTQTEGRDEAEKAKEVVERLQQRLEVMEDTCTKLKRTSHTKEDALLKQLEEAKESDRNSKAEAMKAKQIADAEMGKISILKKQWQERIQDAKEKQKESNCKQVEAEENLLTLSVRMQEEREDLLKKILDLNKIKEEKEREVMRAIKAEVEFVKLKEGFQIAKLTTAKMESEQVSKEFEKVMASPKYSAPDHVTNNLIAGASKWMHNAISCAKMIETLQAGYASITQQIKAGRPLSELPSVPTLEPPPPGPNLHQTLMQLRGIPKNHVGSAGDASNAPMTNGSVAEKSRTHAPRNVASSSQARPSPSVPPSTQTTVSTVATKPHPTPMVQTNAASSSSTTPVQAQAVATARKRKSFNDLIIKLNKSIPELSREDMERYTHQVRIENNGLTGLYHVEIEQKIRDIMIKNGHKKEKPPPQPRRTSATAPWAGATRTGRFENLDEVEDDDLMCPICCDPLKDRKEHVLECKHKFHFDCISKWMQKQRTCPNCRKFMVDTSEFPSLANGEEQAVPPGLLRNRAQAI